MNNTPQGSKVRRTYNLTATALVAALYVVVTFMVAPFAFGTVQLRLSEGLNHLAAWNKRYVVAVALGVFIANLWSPLGWIDWVFGTLGTLIMTTLTYYFSRNIESALLKIAISTITVITIGMGILAAEFTFAFHINASGASAPADVHASIFGQWLSFYVLVVPGELASLLLGGVIIYALSKVINLKK
ncbi:QueT transporter family protein [Eupransor demetentiae]|uniref:Membrane (S) component (QueT) n=1 Tax=Eupransor demetentiae TaxID=3109584 RepID=A0ABP0EP08_9LACO|nr:ECF-type transporter of queuosine precursor [Lactobacillaceae bacterium LMG 33000]